MDSNFKNNRFITLIKELLTETVSTGRELMKVTIPVIIVTKILEEFGLIIYISRGLEPVMGLMGLPGSLGLVWATGIFATPLSAMAVFASLAPGLDLSTAQVTILCSILLIAHALPVEMSISKRAGAGLLPIGAIRLFGALVYGMILHWICVHTDLWQESAQLLFNVDPSEKTIGQWGIAQLYNLGLIVIVIFCILSCMRLLRVIGFLSLLERTLKPILPFFGMTHRAAPVTVVGMILGIAYGGALIIKETTTGTMNRREIFNSLALMALCHGLIEDTLLMMAMGGKLGGILWGRLLFSLVVMFLIVRIIDLMRPERRV